MASGSSPVSLTGSGKDNFVVRKENDVSKSTDRRYNEVVQEYMKNKLLKSDSTRSNIPPSQVLTLHADNAGPEEGSYVSWECPDTPNSPRRMTPKDTEWPENVASVHSGFIDEEESDPKFFKSVDSNAPLSVKAAQSPRVSSRYGTPDSKASSSSIFVDSFKSADPFSPYTRNVVSLSFASVVSSDEEIKQTPITYKNADKPPLSGASQGDSDVILFPQNVLFSSPDRNKHGLPLTTFSRADGVLNDSDFSVVQIQTPAESLELEMSKNEKKTPVSPHTPTIRVTSVKGSSHNVFRGNSSEDVTQCPASWKGMSASPVERQRQCKTPLQLDTIYPPDETDAKTYSFTAPSCTSNKTFIVNTSTSPHSAADSAKSSPKEIMSPTSPNWHMSEDLDFNQDQTDYERTLDFRERFGWFLIIVGSALLISSVIVILAIEIPAHREKILGSYPGSEPLVNYFEEFKGFILAAPTQEPSVVSTAPILSDTIELLFPGNET